MTRLLGIGAVSRARKIFFVLHLWLGLILGAWLVMMGATGSVLAWLPDLLPMELQARYPFERQGAAPMIAPSAALASFEAAHPEVPAAYLGAPAGQFSHYYGLVPGAHEGEMDVVWIDPYSGRAYAPRAVESLTTGWIAHFHASLLAGPRGLVANGIGSALGVVMLLSGLWLWWPANLRQLRARLAVKREGSWRRQLLDWHNVLGVYLFGLLFVTTLTGALLVLNSQTEQGIEKRVDALAGQSEPPPMKLAPQGARRDLDELVATARGAAPGLTLSGLSLPMTPEAPLQATFERAGGLLRNTRVTLNPYSGAVLRIERDDAATAGHKTASLIGDLHFGVFGGVPVKLLYTLTGLMPMGLFVTGLLMWWKRLSARRQVRGRTAEVIESVETVSV